MSRLLAFALFLTLLARPAAAQDAIDRLADALDMSDEQVEIVEDVFQPGDAGSVWTLVAELHPTLTDAQRAQLLARPERPRARMGQGRRGGRGQRGGRRGRSDAERAAERAARDAALGLDAEQSAALDAAIAARRQAGPGGGALALPESLSPEQAEMIQMQRGLIRLALRRGRR